MSTQKPVVAEKPRFRLAKGHITALVLGGLLLSVLSVTFSASIYRIYETPFPRGYLSPLLYAQRLAHAEFHDHNIKAVLARAAGPPENTAIAVVGVEWGVEVIQFANMGYRVHAFEPMKRYVQYLKKQLKFNTSLDVRLHQVAAGDSSKGTISLSYNTERSHESVRVPRARLDDFVNEQIAVLSVDIQGNELDVLKGATKLMNNHGVRSLWIEIFACSQKVRRIMDLLDEKYVMFDFVPWGRARSIQWSERDQGGYALLYSQKGRPASFDAYNKWLCHAQRNLFHWIQSDILAVRRDLLTPQLLATLGRLRQTYDNLHAPNANAHAQNTARNVPQQQQQQQQQQQRQQVNNNAVSQSK